MQFNYDQQSGEFIENPTGEESGDITGNRVYVTGTSPETRFHVEIDAFGDVLAAFNQLVVRFIPTFVFPPQAAPASPALSVWQPWVTQLPLMQQAVLAGSIRAPDGVRKHHPCKLVYRMFRRTVMLGSFERRALDPFEAGGGSFTAPLTKKRVLDAAPYFVTDPILQQVEDGTPHPYLMQVAGQVYLDEVDTMPLHAFAHLVHAAEIVGYKHPAEKIRDWWLDFYCRLVYALHLQPEGEAEMDRRLGDNEADWKARDVVERPERTG